MGSFKTIKYAPKGVKVKARSSKEIAEIANTFRQVYGKVGTNQPLDIIKLLEITVPKETGNKFEFEILDASEMDEEAGMSPDSMRMYIREDVYEALHMGDSRAKFTIAHEFGHMLLHRGIAFNRSFTNNHKPYQDSEWQANYFAAELLAPLEGCKGLSGIVIMQKYDISYQCAQIREEQANKN